MFSPLWYLWMCNWCSCVCVCVCVCVCRRVESSFQRWRMVIQQLLFQRYCLWYYSVCAVFFDSSHFLNVANSYQFCNFHVVASWRMYICCIVSWCLFTWFLCSCLVQFSHTQNSSPEPSLRSMPSTSSEFTYDSRSPPDSLRYVGSKFK